LCNGQPDVDKKGPMWATLCHLHILIVIQGKHHHLPSSIHYILHQKKSATRANIPKKFSCPCVLTYQKRIVSHYQIGFIKFATIPSTTQGTLRSLRLLIQMPFKNRRERGEKPHDLAIAEER
jgi:hypothetical protein